MGASTPILGVCLGHQGIVEAYGGTVANAGRVRHGKTSPIVHDGTGILRGIPSPFAATRYHSLVGERTTIPDCLVVNATAGDDGEVMGVRHRTHPVVGVQFHPESIMTQHGKSILGNFLEDVAALNMHEDVIRLAGAAGCGGGAARVMEYMLAGEGTDETYASILGAMASREQSDGELGAMLDAIRGFMVRVEWNGDPAIDVCGTGGDGLGTFNVSTAAAFVAAAAGAVVAKHGNRSSSGGSGSAEIFEGLGVDVTACPVERMLETYRICFMFAPRYHRAARHVAAARRMLGRRTVFNTLGRPSATPPACAASWWASPTRVWWRGCPAYWPAAAPSAWCA